MEGKVGRHNFSDEETEAQRQAGTCPRSHSQRTRNQDPGVFYSQAGCLSTHPHLPIYKMGTILIPFLSLEQRVRMATHLVSSPELHLPVETVPVPMLLYLLGGEWLLTFTCLWTGQPPLPHRKEAGEESLLLSHAP